MTDRTDRQEGAAATPSVPEQQREHRQGWRMFLLLLPPIGFLLIYFSRPGELQFWIGLAFISALGFAISNAGQEGRLGLFEELLLAEILILSLVGISITNISPSSGLTYWAGMSLMMAISALEIGAVRMVGEGRGRGKFLLAQIVHWTATLLVLLAVHELYRAGRLNHDNAALVLLLILGLSTFLDGYRISWRFALIGVLLAATALMAAYVEKYTWPMFVLGFLLALAIISFGFLRRRSRRKETHDRTLAGAGMAQDQENRQSEAR